MATLFVQINFFSSAPYLYWNIPIRSCPIFYRTSLIFSLDKRCVGELVSAGARVTAEDNDRQTPLMALISYAKGDVQQLGVGLELVKRGADANTTDKNGRTLLHLCAGELHDCVGLKDQRSHIISELVQRGASLDGRTAEGKLLFILQQKMIRKRSVNSSSWERLSTLLTNIREISCFFIQQRKY